MFFAFEEGVTDRRDIGGLWGCRDFQLRAYGLEARA